MRIDVTTLNFRQPGSPTPAASNFASITNKKHIERFTPVSVRSEVHLWTRSVNSGGIAFRLSHPASSIKMDGDGGAEYELLLSKAFENHLAVRPAALYQCVGFLEILRVD